MKKFDLHIHTIPSVSDHPFDFSLDKLKEYVSRMRLDAIAITNHNLFDKNQFLKIKSELDKIVNIVVFPGVEVDLCGGHLLVITSANNIDDLNLTVSKLADYIKKQGDYIDLKLFNSIFTDLSKYLLIPHFDKDPKLPLDVIRKFGNNIFTGEVASPKKFLYLQKNKELPYTPVLFSDIRPTNDMKVFPSRQTFIDIGDITISALKTVLKDKTKVFLDSSGNQNLIELNNGEIKISQGLNIILGRRSSGKTHTLNLIQNNFGADKVKYIRQFELLQKDEAKEKSSFDAQLSERKSSLFDEYLEKFKDALDKILILPTEEEDNDKLEKYIMSLKSNAHEQNLNDIFSKSTLFNEQLFDEEATDPIEKLIKSIIFILDNSFYKDLIDEYIDRNKMINLLIKLYNNYVQIREKNAKKKYLNELIDFIKEKLKLKSSITQIDSIDFQELVRNRIERSKFIELCTYIQRERVIASKQIRHFYIEARTKCYTCASDMKQNYSQQVSFANAFLDIEDPMKFISDLKEVSVSNKDMYKLFINIVYKVYNADGFELSGGEQSEFNLLNSISDAANYDMLLLDEPESSFDNLFLKDDVNQLLKEFAREMPVIVVTHNNTIGATINPNFLIYTEKNVVNGVKKFDIYYGAPTDKQLRDKNNKVIPNFNVQMNSLEAGENAYLNREQGYENLKN